MSVLMELDKAGITYEPQLRRLARHVLLKQFTEMQRMMKKMSGKGGMRKMMGQMKNMLPPGFGGGGRGPF